MVIVVGILGLKGSGKDAAGSYLVENCGFERDSFANPLKDVVAATFGWDRELVEGATGESRAWRETPDVWWEQRLDWSNHPGSKISTRFTPRIALQFMGTEVMRGHFHDNVWILSMDSRLRNKKRVVITDCRFTNEVNVVRRNNGMVIRIKRGPEPVWYDTAIAALGGDHTALDYMHNESGIHVSEWGWVMEKVDAIVENDGSLLDLESKIACLTQNLY